MHDRYYQGNIKNRLIISINNKKNNIQTIWEEKKKRIKSNKKQKIRRKVYKKRD